MTHSGPRATPEYYRVYSRRWRRDNNPSLKLEALEVYGGAYCRDCGETDVTKLSLDHVRGDGAAHRKMCKSNGGSTFYRALRRAGWPNDTPLQVLCLSCNTRKANRARIA